MRWISVVLVLSGCAWASARDLFVNNVGGSDTNNGATANSQGRNGPFRTIERALRAVRPGDRLSLVNTGEPYRESLTLQGGRLSGDALQPFVIVGNGAVLDGTERMPDEGWRFHRDEIFRIRMLHSGLLLYAEGVPLPERRGEGRVPKLEPRQWSQIGTDVYFRPDISKLPSDHDVRFTARDVGITLYDVRHVVIEDLVVQGFRLDGVNAHDGVSSLLLIGVTARGNGRSGISIGGSSRAQLVSCLVGNNRQAQVRTEGACDVLLRACDLVDNTAPSLVKDGGNVEVIEE